MTRQKQRLTVTVDPELVQAGNRAVAVGDADSMSGWVSTALADKVRKDKKVEALSAAISDYEAQFGEIKPEEMRVQKRADREDAVVVRSRRSDAAGSGRTQRGGGSGGGGGGKAKST